MSVSDWSSDVCSSDLLWSSWIKSFVETFHKTFDPRRPEIPTAFTENEAHTRAAFKIEEDRKSVV